MVKSLNQVGTEYLPQTNRVSIENSQVTFFKGERQCTSPKIEYYVALITGVVDHKKT